MKRRKRAELYNNSHAFLFTESIPGDVIRKRYRVLLKELAVLIHKMDSGTLVLNYGEKVANTCSADLIRVLSEWSQNDFIDLSIRNIIVDAILSSENKQIGSGMICLLSLLADYNVPDEKIYVRSTIKDLEATISYFLGSGLLSKITRKSLDMGALGSTIRFDLSNGKDFVLESVDAVNIAGHVHPIFQQKVHRMHRSHIVCVDGIIESLGEIDGILQDSAENKKCAVICALGFHPDVVNTLLENWKENRLKVVPFIVARWDKDKKITALEACSKLGLNCVAREKGDVISSQTLEDFSIVENLYISSQSIAIQNETGESKHLEIKIPRNMSKMAGLIEDRIRITLQACTGVAKWGVASSEDFDFMAKNLGIKTPVIPRNASTIGIKTASRCKDIIKNMGIAVIPDIK